MGVSSTDMEDQLERWYSNRPVGFGVMGEAANERWWVDEQKRWAEEAFWVARILARGQGGRSPGGPGPTSGGIQEEDRELEGMVRDLRLAGGRWPR
jgi:hypothetical protein